ncbi:MAG: hypothetical protein U9Q98_09455 [Bacteroidota bacterium]|nr:hypothetical protein [Bacteroidota bacterium]
MNTKRIIVQNPGGDSMGSTIKSLINTLQSWYSNHNIIVDLSNVNFVHPALILPLSAIISEVKTKEYKVTTVLNQHIQSYLSSVYFPDGLNVNANPSWKETFRQLDTKNYMPICKIPAQINDTTIREQLLSTFETILIKQLALTGQIITVLKYLISESIDNIVDHSESHNGWIMV